MVILRLWEALIILLCPTNLDATRRRFYGALLRH